MKTLGIVLLILASTAAYGQQTTQKPGAVLSVQDQVRPHGVDVQVGAVEIDTAAARIRVAYLPRLAPLPGTAVRPSLEMPNGLALTSTSIPLRPGTRPVAAVRVR